MSQALHDHRTIRKVAVKDCGNVTATRQNSKFFVNAWDFAGETLAVHVSFMVGKIRRIWTFEF